MLGRHRVVFPRCIARAVCLLGLAALLPAAASAVSFHSTAIDISPDGQEGWVVHPDNHTVSVFATGGAGDNTLLAEIPVGREPWCVDVHPSNGEVWVTSLRDDRVYILDGPARTVIDSLDAGFETFGVAFNPSGTTALVTSSGTGEVFAVDVATRAITDTLSLYQRPRGIEWKPDGTKAWISHLLMPEFFGRISVVFTSTWTTGTILVKQVFGTDLAGYPSAMQNITLAPAPGDSVLWVPNNLINTTSGGLTGNPLTPTNIFHAVVRPVNVELFGGTDLNGSTYFMSESGTPVAGPIAVDFKSGKAFVANLNSDDVTVMTSDLLDSPSEIATIPAGSGPIGIVTHPTLDRAYVANWISRDVTVIDTQTNSVVTTFVTSTQEKLSAQVLNGQRLFFTSRGPMSFENRGSCAQCHVFGRSDARPWDLSQFGKMIRSTPDIRMVGETGAHDWTSDKDEMADHEFGIREFTGGVGLIPGQPNDPLGAPNAGISQDLDDIGFYMARFRHRPDTPFLAPGGGLTAGADSGMTLFNDPTVGCANCHSGPLFTDSVHQMPFIKHDVGTADPADTNAAAGFDTPSLVGVWDTGPYLHNALAPTLRDVLTTFNASDQHGSTSQLASDQIDFIVAYLKSIGAPAPGSVVGAGEPLPAAGPDVLAAAYPNPFREGTSLSFSIERSPSKVRIDLYDVSGRRVRTLLDREMPRGGHVVGWDSRNDDGDPVATGTYFSRLWIDDGPRGGKKLTVLR